MSDLLRAANARLDAELQQRAAAVDLFLSERTIERHLSNIFTKLDLSTRTAATAWAYDHGLI